MSLNNMVMLIGYVGQHLKMSKTSNGIKRMRIRVASHDVYKNEKKEHRNITGHKVIAWDSLADLAASPFVKGSRNPDACSHNFSFGVSRSYPGSSGCDAPFRVG